MKTSQQIRQEFIDFFTERHGHQFVPSSPVVPHDDPTLLFTNAGMNQFKPIFLGQERRPYTRAANTQKCIRAGGKHNDLDDVGRSRRHHTFFEMLGNWSFGDYFKRGAIEMSWELLTKVWGLDPTRLHVSCFEGDEKNGVPRDTESADLWKEVAGLPDDRIHFFGKDNFWEMGDTGPCGPCTEIYVDRTPDKSGGPLVNGDDPRVMEIWNNVFIQYNRNADRSLSVLPSQHVDTGMGFERITQVLQGVDDNYAIDLFNPFWEALTNLSGIKYAGQYPKSNAADPVAEAATPQLRHDIAFRVIADHIRCLTFALTDGATPSNEGRGYVLRRILRRAVRFGRQQLELKEPFLNTLVPVVVNAMGGAFPELKKNPRHVAEIVKEEELSFSRTLDRGTELFLSDAVLAFSKQLAEEQTSRPLSEKVICTPTSGGSFSAEEFEQLMLRFHNEGTLPGGSNIRLGFARLTSPPQIIERLSLGEFDAGVVRRYLRETPVISAKVAFRLHDTYGFPIDLTRIMAEERGMSVDINGYEELMEKARQLARSGGEKGDARLWELSPDALAYFTKGQTPETDDSAKFKAAPIGATIVGIWDGARIINRTHGPEAAGQGVAIVLDKTNFYAEMGGQVGDTGELRGTNGGILDVTTTRAVAGYVLHIGQMTEGHLTVGEHVTATLTGERPRTEKNHTATHLANWALREVLGEGVQQKGSLVDPEKLRFDFSHGKAVGDEELGKIETLVQECIDKRLPVYAEEAPQEQALKIHGLRAVFGEKYPPMVRVVSIGAPVADLLDNPADAKWCQFSVEFCGGTHLKNTSEIEGFVVTAEESVSKGIRRILGLTGDAARQAQQLARELNVVVDKARAQPEPELPAAIAAIQRMLSTPGLPLREKRKAQTAVADLQAKYKAWEKKNNQQGGGNVDILEAATKLLAAAPDLAGGKLIIGAIDGATDDQLRAASDSLRKRAPSAAIMLASAGDAKVSFLAVVSDDLIAKGLKAGDWIRETAKAAGGGGGGRPQMAQAGGKDPSKLNDALEAARSFAATALTV